MKAFLHFFFLVTAFFSLLILLTPALQAQTGCSYTWTAQSTGTTAILNSVKAVSSSVCWVSGNSGTIRRTTNGGATWINGNPNPGMISGNVENIEAIDAINAWCSTSPGANTFIYKTTDGGNIWTIVYANTSGFINGIRMVSSVAGYAFGSPLNSTLLWNILVTANGGTTWLPLPTRPQGQAGEQGFNNCVQVSLPNMWFGASLGSVYRSTNGGLNWTNAPTPGIVIYVQALHFNSQMLGLASGTTMDKSTNGGATFFPLPVPGAGNINGIEGSGNDFWFVRGSDIYRSTNAGSNWVLEHNTGITMLAIDFVDNTSGCLEGWAVGYAGTAIKMTGVTVGTVNNQNSIPEIYKLEQNYPNPFNPVTNISFAIPKAGFVRLTVNDLLGRESSVLVNEYKNAGNYSVKFDASNLPSGVYFYKLEAGGFTAVKKMMVLK
jgi:photosystem II stability/assembly factor-like uncharacterized protein